MTSNCKWFSIPVVELESLLERSLDNFIVETSRTPGKEPIKLKIIREQSKNGMFESKYYFYGSMRPVVQNPSKAEECGEPCFDPESSKFYTAYVKSLNPLSLNSLCYHLLKDCRCQIQSYTLVITPIDRKKHLSKSTVAEKNRWLEYYCSSDFQLQIEVQVADPDSNLLATEAEMLELRARDSGVDFTSAEKPKLLGKLLGQSKRNSFTTADDINFLEIIKQSSPYLVANGRNNHSSRFGESVGFFLKDDFNEKVIFDPYATDCNYNVSFTGGEFGSYQFIDAMIAKYASSEAEIDYAYTIYGLPENYPSVIGLNNAQYSVITRASSHNFDIVELVSSFKRHVDKSKDFYIEHFHSDFVELAIGYLLELVEDKMSQREFHLVGAHLQHIFQEAMSTEETITTQEVLSLCRLSPVPELVSFANELEATLFTLGRLLDTSKQQELTPGEKNYFVDSTELTPGGDEELHIQHYVWIFSLLMNSYAWPECKSKETGRLTHRYVCMPIADENKLTRVTESIIRRCRMKAISCLSVLPGHVPTEESAQYRIDDYSTIRVNFDGMEPNSMIVSSSGMANKLYL